MNPDNGFHSLSARISFSMQSLLKLYFFFLKIIFPYFEFTFLDKKYHSPRQIIKFISEVGHLREEYYILKSRNLDVTNAIINDMLCILSSKLQG